MSAVQYSVPLVRPTLRRVPRGLSDVYLICRSVCSLAWLALHTLATLSFRLVFRKISACGFLDDSPPTFLLTFNASLDS